MLITNVVIGVLILALILYRQRRIRAARQDVRWWLVAFAAVDGGLTLFHVLQGHAVTAGVVGLLALSMLIGAGMGAWRGLTVRVWRQDGQVLRQGTPQTIALWLVAIAAHLVLDMVIAHASVIHGIGESSILLYLAVTWAAQGMTVANRAARLRPVS